MIGLNERERAVRRHRRDCDAVRVRAVTDDGVRVVIALPVAARDDDAT